MVHGPFLIVLFSGQEDLIDQMTLLIMGERFPLCMYVFCSPVLLTSLLYNLTPLSLLQHLDVWLKSHLNLFKIYLNRRISDTCGVPVYNLVNGDKEVTNCYTDLDSYTNYL